MIALARQSARSKMPVTHWIFSWQEGEQPSRDQVEELVDVFMERMELVGHQIVYGLHYDTENYHLHIAVNRMNPETGKVVRPHNGFDKREAHKILAIIKHRQGWASEKKSLYTVLENGELARRRMEREVKPRPAALEFENATGEKSAQRIAQERGHSIIENAKTWVELHENLARVGLRFERKGSGAIVWVGDTAVKASSVDRAFGMKKLSARLGEFEDGNYTETPEKMTPEPVSSVNLEEWKAYQAEFADSREQQRQTQTEETRNKIASLKRRQQREREIKLPRLAKYGLPVLNIARHCLKLQHRQEMRELRQRLSKPQPAQGRPRFETWLRSRGMKAQADRWRHRDRQEEKRHTPAPLENAIPTDSREPTLFRRYAIAVNGDSLLGIHRLEQLTQLRMDTESGQQYQLRIFGQNVKTAVNEAIELRKRLRATTIRDIKDVEVMARLDREARRKLESVELIADAMIGEALRCGGNTRALNIALDTLATMAGDFLSGNEGMGELIAHQAKTALAVDLPTGKPTRKPLHWALEFPEVFELGGFNGIVGNPPFMGGRKISSSFGIAYLNFLTTVRSDINGIADLVCHFFRRSFDLMVLDGVFGLLATKSISEVDSRRGGLGAIISEGGTIFCANVNHPWPGKAAVLVSSVHVSKSDFSHKRLNGEEVEQIPPSLQQDTPDEIEPNRLSMYIGKARSGSKIMGDGFKLTHAEAAELLTLEPEARPLIKELLGGTDITTTYDQRPSRLVIDPGQMDEDELKKLPFTYRRLKEMVYPSRSKSKDVAKKKYWWRFAGPSTALYK
nr:relaxase/mobilization nuclease domain-containing protein [Bilophila wadsworthia]